MSSTTMMKEQEKAVDAYSLKMLKNGIKAGVRTDRLRDRLRDR